MIQGPGKRDNTYSLVYGMKGQGKTILLRSLMAYRAARGGSYTFVDRTHNDTPPGAVEVATPAGWWAHVRAARRTGRPWAIRVKPGRGADLNPLWAMVYEVGGQLLAIDESQYYANAHRIDPDLDELVSLGRNQRVDIAAAVRTPPEQHGRLRGNADVVFSFCQPSRRYAEILNREFFFLARPEIMTQLPKFEYLRAEQGNVTRGVLPVPAHYRT